MKHNLNATVVIIAVFFLTQIAGLYLVNLDITSINDVNGTITIEHQETAIGPRPETTGGESFLYIAIAITIGTFLVLLIIKYQKLYLWKTWFFLAIFLSISIALGVILNTIVAFIAGLALAALKMYKRNVLVHNFTEVLMYSGLAVLLVPILDIIWVVILLLAISVYDMYAVWKSKHMVKMANFQAKSKMFTGLMIPYEEKKGIKLDIPRKPELKAKKPSKVRNAILGGGDVAFPLIFSGVAMESLILKGIEPVTAFFHASIISVAVTIAVLGIFIFAKKDKFYPAMPTVTLGCLIGYAVMLLL